MKTKELVENVLNELATLEGHQYKSRAYKHAYEEIANMNIEEFNSRTSFIDIFGIGRGINDKINEVRNTGTCKRLKELREESKDLLAPELYKVRKSFITKRIPLEKAKEYVNSISHFLCEYAVFWVAGSIRREKSLIADIDLICECEEQSTFDRTCDALGNKYKEISRGEYKASYIIDSVNGIELDLIRSSSEEFPFQLLYLTGSKEFNIKMRGIAKSKGYLLNQKGLFYNNIKINKTFLFERDIFDYLNIPYVEPKNR